MALLHALGILILSMCAELPQCLGNQCKDFYSHACKDSKNQVSAVEQRIRDKDRAKLVTMLDSITGADDSPFKSYYRSCLNREGSEKFLESKMKELIRRSFRGEPLEEKDLAKLLDETSTLDNGLFASGFEHKDKNTFAIVSRNTPKSTEIEKSTSSYKEYQQFVRTLFDDLDCLYDENEWNEVLKLEQEILELIKKSQNTGFYFNNGKIFYYPHKKEQARHYNLNELQKALLPRESFNLTDFLNFISDQVLSRVENSKVVFMGLEYFEGLQTVLSKHHFNITARYIMLRGTLSLFNALPQDFQDMLKINYPSGYHLYPYSTKSEDSCRSETQTNLKYLEEQFYMDKIFSGQIKNMADDLFKSIKENFDESLKSCPTKSSNMVVHLGRFELPYVQYKKTTFYNGSYFENLLAFTRDFIRVIAPGERGIGLQNVTDLQRTRKLSYYDRPANTLYILPYVFNTTTKHASEFFGTAGPHIVQALFEAIGKANLAKCSRNKKKGQDRRNPDEYFTEKKLELTYKAFENYRKTKNLKNQDTDLELFFLTFAKEFCHMVPTESHKSMLNKVMLTNSKFKEVFKCK